MGFFDSKSTNNTTNKTRNSSSGAQDGAISAVDSTVSITDGDAIKGAFNVTLAALKGQQEFAEKSIGLLKSANENSLKTVKGFGENVAQPDTSAINKTVMVTTIGLVLVAGAFLLRG